MVCVTDVFQYKGIRSPVMKSLNVLLLQFSKRSGVQHEIHEHFNSTSPNAAYIRQ